jgi:predicted esterase
MHTTADALRFGQPLRDARGVLLLIHGRGSSAEDIAALAEAMSARDFACIAPSAENGTWYPERFFVPLKRNEPWLTGALKTVDSLVEEVISAGITPNRIGLIGFSQGACLTLEHTYRAGGRYAFTAGLSGALIGPLDTARAKQDFSGMPVLLGCAESDGHIPLEHVEHSAAVFERMNATVTKQIYPGGAHTVFPQEVAWINEQLARVAR